MCFLWVVNAHITFQRSRKYQVNGDVIKLASEMNEMFIDILFLYDPDGKIMT